MKKMGKFEIIKIIKQKSDFFIKKNLFDPKEF
jgi:hypothetical protein